MRPYVPILVLLVLLTVAGFFFITTRLVGRHLMAGLPLPNAFAGPELLPGYILQRGLQGPESFIEGPTGAVIVPDPLVYPDRTRAVVSRVAVVSSLIVGEVSDTENGDSLGFFLIDSVDGTASTGLSLEDWTRRVRAFPGLEPPPLHPADSFSEPSPAP